MHPFIVSVTKFNKPLENVETTEFEEAISFECEVSLPQAKVTWLKDGLPLEEGPKYTVVEEGPIRRLVVKDVAKDDEADYTCVVGEQKTQAGLFVESKYNSTVQQGINLPNRHITFFSHNKKHLLCTLICSHSYVINNQ